jgi:glycosyltransferase involved in cell wall biosynthesis
VGGARTSILNTIKALPQVVQNIEFVVCLSQPEPVLANIPQIKQMIVPASNRFAARLKLWVLLPLLTRRLHIDLVHFTKNLAINFLPCPYVVTVHDLTTLRFPETQCWLDVVYWRWIEPVHLLKADGIIAVSQDAANDLTTFYRISPQRIWIVRWAPDDRFLQPVRVEKIQYIRSKYSLPEDYLLYIGILAKKKNLKTLLHTIYAMHQMGKEVHLVIVGRVYPQSDASGDLNLVRTLGLSDCVHYLGEVPDKDLPALYAGAKAYVMPSLHEGFGIPCWEAMAVGTPVIASKRGALPEVVGDAGILVDDPLNVTEWVEAIQQCLEDEQLRAMLIERGRHRVSGRTWQTVAAETFAVYQAVCPSLQGIQIESPPSGVRGAA